MLSLSLLLLLLLLHLTLLLFTDQTPLLTFTRSYEGIDDDLGAIKEISKLRLPHDQMIRILHTHAVFKPKNRFLR